MSGRYSALTSSLAYLPWIAAFSIGAAASTQLLPRTGPRPLMVAGGSCSAPGMYWLSRTGVTDSYAYASAPSSSPPSG